MLLFVLLSIKRVFGLCRWRGPNFCFVWWHSTLFMVNGDSLKLLLGWQISTNLTPRSTSFDANSKEETVIKDLAVFLTYWKVRTRMVNLGDVSMAQTSHGGSLVPEAKNTLRWNPQQQGIGADGRIHFVIPITTPDANKDEIRICGMLYL